MILGVQLKVIFIKHTDNSLFSIGGKKQYKYTKFQRYNLWRFVISLAERLLEWPSVCVYVCVCVCVRGISPSITGWILMKFRMDSPVHHAQCVWQTIEHRSKVKIKVTENTKTTIWAITFEPEVVETSG